ncbi:MAG: hypothetical protein ACRDCE_01515 [Cetobacterium sp.]|uniref:hypothetical protein n=1 Tax=Cetobacterium sp. TaxID=2071632 RepID=UPI003EE56A2E
MNHKLLYKLSQYFSIYEAVMRAVEKETLDQDLYDKLVRVFGINTAEEVNYHIRLLQLKSRTQE